MLRKYGIRRQTEPAASSVAVGGSTCLGHDSIDQTTNQCRAVLPAHFALAARHVHHKNVLMKPIARRGGASSQGELS